MHVHDVVSHSDELGLLNRLGEDIRRHVQVGNLEGAQDQKQYGPAVQRRARDAAPR